MALEVQADVEELDLQARVEPLLSLGALQSGGGALALELGALRARPAGGRNLLCEKVVVCGGGGGGVCLGQLPQPAPQLAIRLLVIKVVPSEALKRCLLPGVR